MPLRNLSQRHSTVADCGGLGHVFGLVPSDHADWNVPFSRNHEFPPPILGSAPPAPRQGVPERFPNPVEGNGVRGHRDVALLGELTQQRLLALLLSPYGLCERKGDL